MDADRIMRELKRIEFRMRDDHNRDDLIIMEARSLISDLQAKCKHLQESLIVEMKNNENHDK